MNTNTAKFLFEGISADVVRYLVERNDMDLQEAISTFHNSRHSSNWKTSPPACISKARHTSMTC
ncbi:MAG: hypothetical protein ACLVEE_07620 [Phocaeicola vulgatus]